jgi:hypothetical protein
LFGLKPGDDAITSTAPVFGLSTTAAPHEPASADSASFCAFAWIVSVTLLPVTVVPRSLSVSLAMIVPRFAFDAVR